MSGSAPRLHDVDSFDRRARMRTAAELAGMLAGARLALLGWRRVFDIGPLPLVRAAVAVSG